MSIQESPFSTPRQHAIFRVRPRSGCQDLDFEDCPEDLLAEVFPKIIAQYPNSISNHGLEAYLRRADRAQRGRPHQPCFEFERGMIRAVLDMCFASGWTLQSIAASNDVELYLLTRG